MRGEPRYTDETSYPESKRLAPLWEVETVDGELVQVRGWTRAEARQAARKHTGKEVTTYIAKQ